jgi:VWFA-related protein
MEEFGLLYSGNIETKGVAVENWRLPAGRPVSRVFAVPVLLIGLGAFPPPGAGQTGQAPSIRAEVREVLVPVIVTDKKGHHVTGLKASDFRLEEDGVPQEITGFSTDTAASASLLLAAADRAANNSSNSASAPVAAAAPEPLRHTYVICVDTLHTAMPDSARTREALTRLFDREKSAGAQFVIVGIGRQLRVLRTATADPAAVIGTLKNPAFQPALGGGDAAALSSELNDLKNRMYDFCRRCPACGARSQGRACDTDIQNLKSSLDAEAERWAALDRQMLAQLRSVVEEIAKLPTARTLILVSDGFSLQPTSEFYGVAGSFLPSDPRFRAAGPTDLEPELKQVIRSAVERNVRVYSLNALGVEQPSFASNGSMDASAPSDRSAPSVIRRVPPSNRGGTLLADMDHAASSVAIQNGSAMEQLARATGGVYFHDSNDTLKELRSAIGDGRDYYLLAYVSKNGAKDGAFRAITVEVADKKLNVRAKSGYWSEGERP